MPVPVPTTQVPPSSSPTSSPASSAPLPNPVRLLVVPGLGDSPKGHWQSWLEQSLPGSVRVTQHDWQRPDLERWAGRIAAILDREGPGAPWLVAAHSFGVLAVLRHVFRHPDPRLGALLLVAPADPDRFGLGDHMPGGALPTPATLVLSSNDPWLPTSAARHWARRWQLPVVNLGAAGHINVASGFGPWPYARRWVDLQAQRLAGSGPVQPARWSPARAAA